MQARAAQAANASSGKGYSVIGRMVEDVKLSVNGKKPVYFYGRTGGNVPDEEEIIRAAKESLAKANG